MEEAIDPAMELTMIREVLFFEFASSDLLLLEAAVLITQLSQLLCSLWYQASFQPKVIHVFANRHSTLKLICLVPAPVLLSATS